MVTKIITIIAVIIILYLILYRGDETVDIIRALAAGAIGTIRALQGR